MRHVVASKNADQRQGANNEIEIKAINEFSKDNISRTTIFYANQMLRTLALCYWDFIGRLWGGTRRRPSVEAPYEDLSRNMTLVAITGIEDPLRPGVGEAVAPCHHAGVTVKIIMEGPVFRALDPHDCTEVVPRLQVPARSS